MRNIFWRILVTIILISTCCFGSPLVRPQYDVVDVYVYDQNPVSRQQPGNGDLHCTGRNCVFVPNQRGNQWNGNQNGGTPNDMIIVLVPDDQHPNNIYPTHTIPNRQNPQSYRPGQFQPPPHQSFPTYPAPHQPIYPAPHQPIYPAPHQPTYPAPHQPTYPTPHQPTYPAPHKPFSIYPVPPHQPNSVYPTPPHQQVPVYPTRPHQPVSTHPTLPHQPASHPTRNTRPNSQLPNEKPDDNDLISGWRPDTPLDTSSNNNNNNDNRQGQQGSSNCPFGNFFCNNNFDNDGVEPTPLDEAIPSSSPVNSIPTTTASIDEIIDKVFDTPNDKPVHDIDVRIDSK